jgi:hypothetical protein
MNIEWARDSDAEAIMALLASDGLFLQGGNWTGLGKTWLVARTEHGIIACIAYHPGRPFARLDFLSIDKEVHGLSKVRVVRAILEAAFAVCALHGSSFVTGVVPYYLADYGEFLAKRGGKQINEGWLFMASLSDVLKRRNEVHGRLKNHNHNNRNPDRGRERIH